MADDIALHLDFETRSTTDLTRSGVFRYAEDPYTWPWGFSYRFGNLGPAYRWLPGMADPDAVLEHVWRGGRVVCHGAQFERTIWNEIIIKRICHHWPRLAIKQQDCTMARAAAVAYPQKLDWLGAALKAQFLKDDEGHRLMLKMMRPRRYNPDGSVTWWDEPENVERLMLYCDRDVIAETNADELLPQLSPASRLDWELDQVINERGVCLDIPAVRRCADLVAYSKKQNDKIMRELTDRAVPKCSNDAKIITWLNSRGIQCDSLAKGVVDDVITLAACYVDDKADQVIKLRQAAWKTSTAKYGAMLDCVSSDNRGRGWINWHGASTGRRAGRLVQPQNFPRVDPDDTALEQEIDWLHKLLAENNYSIRDVYEIITSVYGPLEALTLLSKALRSMIVAGPGNKLVGGDFANIEGRVNAWFAREAWKLQAFIDYDNGVGRDLYTLAYANMFGVTPEMVGRGQKRQIGKVSELALGYQGGIGSYLSMGPTYGVNVFEISGPVEKATPSIVWDETAARYHRPGVNRHNLFEREWTACQILVDSWRRANANIVKFWWHLQDAAVEAVASPGRVVAVPPLNNIQYYSDERCLWCILPSGRMLCYSEPSITEKVVEYIDKKTGETRTYTRYTVWVWGQDGITKQWTQFNLYGGLQCENVVSGAACCLLISAMQRIEAAGFPVVLSVHDEILSEPSAQRTDLNDKLFASIMAQKDAWATDLPVTVKAFEDTRYVK